MNDPTFSYQHRVTYADCTVGNHIYYARYLNLLEAARGEFFRKLGTSFLQWQERDTIFPVIECHLRYTSAARYDDVLNIEVWPTAIERVRLNFFHRVVKQANALVLEAETYHVCAAIKWKTKENAGRIGETSEAVLEETGNRSLTSKPCSLGINPQHQTMPSLCFARSAVCAAMARFSKMLNSRKPMTL